MSSLLEDLVKLISGVKSEVQSALSASLTRVLTPKTSTDILLEIQRKRSSPSSLSSPDAPPDPYALTFVGVNGVGKSTNLSKVCFWLLQNGLRVLIAACDTFRSGAVEQLRVHVRNLGALGDEMGMGMEAAGKRKIELYERGYGKDAAGIAKDAIAYGQLLGPARHCQLTSQQRRTDSTWYSSTLPAVCKIMSRLCELWPSW